ncbi:MAG: hypothetical protein JNK37_22300 [Verrucomicrobiales bacterium]|nr:hypothetical protein [Verrucomicrobiales bacterium]
MRSIALFSLIIIATFGGDGSLRAAESTPAPWPPRRGDLIVGFQATRGVGSEVNLFLNLGAATGWRDGDGKWVAVAHLGAELTRHYGDGWFSRTDLWIGAIANRSNIKSDPVREGDPPRSFYLSRSAREPGASRPWTGLSEMALGSAATFLSGQYDMLATLEASGAGTATVRFSDVIRWQNGWTHWNPVDARGQQMAYRRFPGGIQQHFGQTAPGPVCLDIQRVEPGAEIGRVVFSLVIDSTGRLSVGRGPLP